MDKENDELHSELVTFNVPVAPEIEGFTFIKKNIDNIANFPPAFHLVPMDAQWMLKGCSMVACPIVTLPKRLYLLNKNSLILLLFKFFAKIQQKYQISKFLGSKMQLFWNNFHFSCIFQFFVVPLHAFLMRVLLFFHSREQ